MSNKSSLNRFGTCRGRGSALKLLGDGQFISIDPFETLEQALDDGTDLEYRTEITPEEERVEVDDVPSHDEEGYEFYFDDLLDIDYYNRLNTREEWYDDEYYDDDVLPEEENCDLDEVNMNQSGGSLDKSHKIRRLKTPKLDNGQKDTVTISDLPARWQARGRNACNHEVPKKDKAGIAKILRLRRTNYRRARDTIRGDFLAKRQEEALESRLMHNMIEDNWV